MFSTVVSSSFSVGSIFFTSFFVASTLIMIFSLWVDAYKQKILVREKQEELEVLEELAHDIRSPVVGLKVLSHQLSFESEYEQKLFQTSTDRIGKIAQTLLDHTKKKNVQKNSNEETSAFNLLEPLLEEKRLILKNKYPESAGEIKMDFDPSLKIEKKKLEDYTRVLGNLVDNSLDALIPSGKHEVQVLIRKKDPLFFKRLQRSKLVTEVKDTGRGMDQKIQSQLFKKGASFEKKNGNGLGLYSAKKWVQKNGGKIELESTPNVGTKIKFEIQI